MTPTPKRILRTLSTVLGWILLLLLIGVPLSFLLFLALLSGLVPLYVLLPLLSVAAAGILALLLRRWCRPGPRGRCGIAAVFALVCLGAAVWMGWGIYCARLPTLDDRTLLLQDYQPFAPHSRAAVLEEPATLQWDEFTARHLRLDGATALYPVYAAFVQAVWPEGEYPLYAGGQRQSLCRSHCLYQYRQRLRTPDASGNGPDLCCRPLLPISWRRQKRWA